MTAVADYIVEQLAFAGVKRVYGLPGGENVVLLDAIKRRGLEFLLVKNESSACFMAATEARLTGELGVALTTLGPGAANAFTGLAHAHLDRAPILLLTAAPDREDNGRHTHQALDLQAVFQPVCKFTAEIRPENAPEVLGRAFTMARACRPGPVHLSLHNGIASQQIAPCNPPALDSNAPAYSESDLQHTRALIDSSHRPVIVVGLGLEPDAPYAQLRRLAEFLRAPVIDTPKSKGALSADHPLHLGALGLTPHDPAYEVIEEADCIIAVGFDVVELVKPWDYHKPLVWIANWRNRDASIACEAALAGNLNELLGKLCDIAPATNAGWGEERVARFRGQLAAEERPLFQANRILPQAFLSSLRANTPDDIIVTTDVGSHKIFAALNWPARQPNRYFVSNGLSAMGFGLCSAIAAAEVTGHAVVCITGDAGLAMVMGELALLVERKLPVLVALMNDCALDLIRSAQVRQGRSAYGVEFANPAFEFIARAFGLDYYRVESSADCDRAIQDGLAARAPVLIDVMIDPIGYPTSMRETTGL